MGEVEKKYIQKYNKSTNVVFTHIRTYVCVVYTCKHVHVHKFNF